MTGPTPSNYRVGAVVGWRVGNAILSRAFELEASQDRKEARAKNLNFQYFYFNATTWSTNSLNNHTCFLSFLKYNRSSNNTFFGFKTSQDYFVFVGIISKQFQLTLKKNDIILFSFTRFHLKAVSKKLSRTLSEDSVELSGISTTEKLMQISPSRLSGYLAKEITYKVSQIFFIISTNTLEPVIFSTHNNVHPLQ